MCIFTNLFPLLSGHKTINATSDQLFHIYLAVYLLKEFQLMFRWVIFFIKCGGEWYYHKFKTQCLHIFLQSLNTKITLTSSNLRFKVLDWRIWARNTNSAHSVLKKNLKVSLNWRLAEMARKSRPLQFMDLWTLLNYFHLSIWLRHEDLSCFELPGYRLVPLQ